MRCAAHANLFFVFADTAWPSPRGYLGTQPERTALRQPKEHPMRIILGIVIVTILVAVAWSVEPTTANQRPNRAIDPVGMMLTTKNLPATECDRC